MCSNLIAVNLLFLLALLAVDLVLHYLSDICLLILWDLRHLAHHYGILLLQAPAALDHATNFFLLAITEAL